MLSLEFTCVLISVGCKPTNGKAGSQSIQIFAKEIFFMLFINLCIYLSRGGAGDRDGEPFFLLKILFFNLHPG